MEKGLTSSEVELKLRQHGYNELASSKPKNILLIALPKGSIKHIY